MKSNGKLFILILLLFVFIQHASWATSGDTIYCRSCNITNDSIEYDIYFSGNPLTVPANKRGFYVDIDLTPAQFDTLKRYSSRMWLEMLNDERTDYAANIALDYVYDKLAASLYEKTTPEFWRKYSKSSDLEYWKKFLKKRREK